MSVSNKIRALLNFKGQKTKDLANCLGISVQAVRNKFTRDSFSINDLIKISSYLECKVLFKISDSQTIELSSEDLKPSRISNHRRLILNSSKKEINSRKNKTLDENKNTKIRKTLTNNKIMEDNKAAKSNSFTKNSKVAEDNKYTENNQFTSNNEVIKDNKIAEDNKFTESNKAVWNDKSEVNDKTVENNTVANNSKMIEKNELLEKKNISQKTKPLKKFTSADEAEVNLKELLTNVRYQLDIGSIFGMNVLNQLIAKARTIQGIEENSSTAPNINEPFT